MSRRPRSGDTLVVGEKRFCDALRDLWHFHHPTAVASAVRGGGRHSEPWFLEVGEAGSGGRRGGTVSELLDACLPPLVPPFRIDSESGVLRALPISVWPMFGEILVQRDWIVGDELDEGPFAAWWKDPDSKVLTACPPDAPRVVPLGLLLLHLVRHELSTPEYVFLGAFADDPELDSMAELARKDLDSNARIGFLGMSDIDRRWDPAGSRMRLDRGNRERCDDALKPLMETVQRQMRGYFARQAWRALGLGGNDGRGCASHQSPLVVYCDDTIKNILKLCESVGIDPGKEQPLEGTPSFVLLGGTGGARIERLVDDRERWDEAIYDVVEGHLNVGATNCERGSEEQRPIFVICDYDLNSDDYESSLGAARLRPGSRHASLTGAKLAALVRGHIVRERSSGISLVSALAFTGGRSPVIAQECISDGCDFVITKGEVRADRSNAVHASADVYGLFSLGFWVYTLVCHHQHISDGGERVRGGGRQIPITDALRDVCRIVVRRDVAMPRSLEPAMNRLRFEAYNHLSRGSAQGSAE